MDWRHYLGADWEGGRTFLRQTHRMAGTVIHPEHPNRRLVVEPDGDSAHVGIAEDIDDLHPPVPLVRRDIEVLAPDWEVLTTALSQEFHFAGNRWERTGHTRKIGVFQHGPDGQRPVILCLPPGHFMRQTAILGDLSSRKDATIFMPSSGSMSPEIDALVSGNGLTLVGLAEHFEKAAIQESAAPYLAAPALRNAGSKRLQPVLRARTGWTWEMLTIEVATGGRLIFSCDGQRKDYRLPKSKGADHSHSYQILGKLAFAEPQQWKNPATWEKGSDTVRRRFGRLCNQLKALVDMPDEPFHKLRDRVYEPRFRLVPHGDLRAMADEARSRQRLEN
jgi:hypothetical protein